MSRAIRLGLLFLLLPPLIGALKVWVTFGAVLGNGEAALPLFMTYAAITLVALGCAVVLNLWTAERRRMRSE